MAELVALTMPKWGLSMEEGTLASWHLAEGDAVCEGAEIADIETSKLLNTLEARSAGTLLRLVAEEGETLPCGALIAVMGEDGASAGEIDAFVASFVAAEPAAEGQGENGAAPAYRSVEVEGLSLRYAEAGAGEETVLLLHGYGGDSGNWMFVTEDLAGDYRTIALDLPGHGGSDKALPGAGGIEDIAALVLALIEAEGLGRVHLVGHSFGGAVAERVAASGEVASLTLVAPLLPGCALDTDYIADFAAARRKRELREVLTRLVADPEAVSGDMVEDVLRTKRLDGVAAALERLGEVAGEIARAAPRAPASPALAIWGEADRIIAPPEPGALGDEVELHLIAGAGHLPQLEAAAATARLIRRHIAG
jgi:pyruvate dehydrogenase E2 component (dihydrolipoamide acetyltransferase)